MVFQLINQSIDIALHFGPDFFAIYAVIIDKSNMIGHLLL